MMSSSSCEFSVQSTQARVRPVQLLAGLAWQAHGVAASLQAAAAQRQLCTGSQRRTIRVSTGHDICTSHISPVHAGRDDAAALAGHVQHLLLNSVHGSVDHVGRDGGGHVGLRAGRKKKLSTTSELAVG
jgi:hypothetical protein